MAHATADGAYGRLVDRLNRFPQGAPPSDLLYRILRLLFTEREAGLVARSTLAFPALALAGNFDQNWWQVPAFMGMIVVVGLVVYFGAKFVRGRQGIDVDLVYRELPPE